MDLSNWKVNSTVHTVDHGQVAPASSETCQSFLSRAGQCLKQAVATVAIAGAITAGGHAQAATEASSPTMDPYSEAAMLQSAIAGSMESHSLEILRLKAEEGDLDAATRYVETMRSHLSAQHMGGLITDTEMDTYNAEFDRLIAEGGTLNWALAAVTAGASVGVGLASDAANSCIENDKLREGVSGAISLAAMASGDASGAASLKNLQLANSTANFFTQHDTKLGNSLMSASARDTAPSGSLDIDAMATDLQASTEIKPSDGLKF
jgi:hypothetical protein